LSERGGVFHMTASGRTNWYEFATRLLQRIAAPDRRLRSIVPIPSAEYPTPARRPMNSVLDCARLVRMWGVALPPWDLGLDLAVADGGPAA
jgi:dTDP-4-dehydrorhamnose reductase